MYSPITPMESITAPPMAHMDTIRLDQPSTTLPVNFCTSEYMSIMMLTKNTPKPNAVIIRIGLMLSDVIPSTANASIFFRGYLLSPANRSLLS